MSVITVVHGIGHWDLGTLVGVQHDRHLGGYLLGRIVHREEQARFVAKAYFAFPARRNVPVYDVRGLSPVLEEQPFLRYPPKPQVAVLRVVTGPLQEAPVLQPLGGEETGATLAASNNAVGDAMVEVNANERLLKELLASDTWFEKHKGEYVAIVNGRVHRTDRDAEKLVMEVSKAFPQDEKLVVEVRREEEKVEDDLPVDEVES